MTTDRTLAAYLCGSGIGLSLAYLEAWLFEGVKMTGIGVSAVVVICLGIITSRLGRGDSDE